jgi:hypothetical protein
MSPHRMHLNHSDDPSDRGSAMILTLMVMTLITVLTTTISVVTINNLQASGRSRQSGAALSAADAGIAQAVSYLRSAGVGDLVCSPTCKTNQWGNRDTPKQVPMPGVAGQSYKVWIEAVAPFPQNNPATYRIHSTGSAAGAAARPVTADVSITNTSSGVPKGIFAREVMGGGNGHVLRQSIFSTGCVYSRSHIDMNPGEIDLAYGIPIGVHSSQIITDSNGSGQYCTDTGKAIHAPSKKGTKQPCNPDFPYDQDLLGGRLTAKDGCHDTKMDGTGAWARYYSTYDVDSNGSKDPSSLLRSDADLFRIFDFQPDLNQGHLDTLRMLAQSQGTYFTSASTWRSPTTTDNQVVMFFDLTKNPGGTVDLKSLDAGPFNRDPIRSTGSTCPARSLTIVVLGGNVQLNGNTTLAASLILTSVGKSGGKVAKLNGNAELIGTIYADSVDLTGNGDISMDECFLANAGPALTEIAVTSYREEDRSLS